MIKYLIKSHLIEVAFFYFEILDKYDTIILSKQLL